MAAVSQALIEFANRHRQEAAPGVEVIRLARCQVTLQPDFPLPGPNSVSWIRCDPDEVGDLIAEVHATLPPRRLPLMWILDPGSEPGDLGARLEDHGILPDPHGAEVAVMVLPIEAHVDVPHVERLEIVDALSLPHLYMTADAVAAEAFGGTPALLDPPRAAALERRRLNAVAAGNRRQLLALVDGKPAGTGGLSLHAPAAAIINGGAVLKAFRGRGVYRSLVLARLEIARAGGAGGLAVWGGKLSAPILSRLGFVAVGWRRFYLDPATSPA